MYAGVADVCHGRPHRAVGRPILRGPSTLPPRSKRQVRSVRARVAKTDDVIDGLRRRCESITERRRADGARRGRFRHHAGERLCAREPRRGRHRSPERRGPSG